MSAPEDGQPFHILLLADRDWKHHDTGGNGANIWAQVSRWVEAGCRVTVVAGEYPGGERIEHFGPRLTVHRMGTRVTVFPRAMLAVLRGIGRDADVVCEVINGITFLTPLWLRKPRVAMIHHVHRELFIEEFPRTGPFLFRVLEQLPLKLLYRRTRFVTISKAARDDLVREGIPRENITVEYLGVDSEGFEPGERAPEPRLVFVGRLKAYKRIERLFDVLEAIPEATLDVVGDGDHRPELEADVARRGLGDRVRMHGYTDGVTKTQLYARAWVHVTASASEGWSLTVMEAALCGTPSVALAVGGLNESIVDGETGFLARDDAQLTERVREVVEQPELRERMGEAARRRAATFTWDRSAATFLEVLTSAADEGRAARGEPRAGDRSANGAEPEAERWLAGKR
ncbi:MAG TPA: glycosyltransferase family 4 protein [Solirubrobacteraceae bacterium]|nr:glycosyltransferase family 4 protein [Solirubrobacteraceae bacterium]